jgi:hypothetical protein
MSAAQRRLRSAIANENEAILTEHDLRVVALTNAVDGRLVSRLETSAKDRNIIVDGVRILLLLDRMSV